MEMTEVVTAERLAELISAEKTLIEVAYGYHPESGDTVPIRGEEVESMAHELLVLRQRNKRLALAAIEGNPRAVYREYARHY